MKSSQLDLLSEELLKAYCQNLEVEYRRWLAGGPPIYRICFLVGLLGSMAGTGGLLHGAFGDASRGEMQLTCIILLVAVPMGYFAHLEEVNAREVRKEYFAALQELSRRGL